MGLAVAAEPFGTGFRFSAFGVLARVNCSGFSCYLACRFRSIRRAGIIRDHAEQQVVRDPPDAAPDGTAGHRDADLGGPFSRRYLAEWRIDMFEARERVIPGRFPPRSVLLWMTRQQNLN
jgi:hypothetical protein